VTNIPAYKADGLIAIVFDESDAPAGTQQPLRTGAMLVSNYVSAGSTKAADYTPYSLLRSLEDLFAVDHLAKAADKGTPSFAGEILALGQGG
jgi:hypothetical protein